jgi:ABC-2 type transport system permease protein
MKKILAIIWKEAILRFSSTSELLFFIILPIVFTFLLAGGTPQGDEDPRIRLLVVDQANTSISQQIITALEDSTAVRPEVMTLEEAEEQGATVILILPAGLDLQTVRDGTATVELREPPNDINNLVARQAVQTALRTTGSAISAANQALKQAEAISTFESETDRQQYFEDALKLARSLQEETPKRANTITGSTPDDVDWDPRANTSAGQLITWVFIPLFGISALFAYERQQGTLRRILTTPTSKATYLFGTVSAQVLMALFQMTLLVCFGIFVLNLPWGRDPLALFVILAACALAAGAIGTAMGTFIKSEGQATGLSILAGMVLALMGGCWYPIELFPATVQNIVKILPTTWAMQGMLDLVLRGGGLVDVLPEAAVLLGFAVLFFGVGVMRFRYE